MKYIIILIFIAVHLFAGSELGYSTTSPLYTHYTYSFQHIGWMHLALNSIAFISFFKVLEKALPCSWILLCIYAIAVGASFLSEYSTPTMGSSGAIYAMAGMFISISIIGKKLTIIDHRKFTICIIGVVLSLIVSEFRGSVNNTCHLLALAGGIIVGIADKYINNA